MGKQQTTVLPSLDTLASCSASQLRSHFVALFHKKPPSHASRDFLIGNLAWAIQAQQRNKTPAVLRDQLMRRTNPSKRSLKEKHRPGTRLVREWHGVTYEVTVTKKGYRWQEQHYRSLTAIAREITGSGWSGPRFFGLQESKQ